MLTKILGYINPRTNDFTATIPKKEKEKRNSNSKTTAVQSQLKDRITYSSNSIVEVYCSNCTMYMNFKAGIGREEPTTLNTTKIKKMPGNSSLHNQVKLE